MKYKKYGNYLVYEDGRCYSLYSNKFLKPCVKKGGYLQYTLYHCGEKEVVRTHRLVAKLFLDKPDNWEELQINHKDGNKENNHYSNLEWCNAYENNKHARDNGLNNISNSNSERWKNKEWAKKTSQHISENCNNSHIHNPRFRYWIVDSNGKNLTRQELQEILGYSQGFVDRIISKAGKYNEYHHSLLENKIKIIDTKGSQSTIENLKNESK